MIKFIISFSFLFALTASAEEVYSQTDPFYVWIAKSQVMRSDSLDINPNLIVSNYATVDRIANSTPMLKFYADELKRQGVPIDFVVLPLIESGNNPQARSLKNAVGLWQFIPSTGKEWGLNITDRFDERVDVQKSTVAAVGYLRSLYSQFNDWNLVLASYNWGAGSVSKSLRKGLRSPDGHINLNLLPRETSDYLVKFYAFNHTLKENAQKSSLGKYPNRPYLVKIRSENLNDYLNSSPSISALNEPVLKHINGFNLGVAKASPREILVPTETFAKYFKINKISFAQVSDRKGLSSCNNGAGNSYEVKYGETILSIAKRFRLSVDRLIELNPSVSYTRPGIVLSLC